MCLILQKSQATPPLPLPSRRSTPVWHVPRRPVRHTGPMHAGGPWEKITSLVRKFLCDRPWLLTAKATSLSVSSTHHLGYLQTFPSLSFIVTLLFMRQLRFLEDGRGVHHSAFMFTTLHLPSLFRSLETSAAVLCFALVVVSILNRADVIQLERSCRKSSSPFGLGHRVW